MTTLGLRIRNARAAAGISQDAVAEHFGVDRSSVAHWEADRNGPGRKRLPHLAKLLNVPLQWLLEGGEGGPNTMEEAELLALYRQLTAPDKRLAARLLRNFVAEIRVGIPAAVAAQNAQTHEEAAADTPLHPKKTALEKT